MRYTDENSFSKAVRSGISYRVYLLYGSEAYLIEKWAKTLMGKSVESAFNSLRLDGQAPDLEAIGDALEALPLFAEEKRVFLDDLDVSKLNERDMEAFSSMLSDIPESSTLIITAKSSSFAGSAAGKKLIKLTVEYGASVELSIRGQGDLVKFLQSAAKKLDCELSGDVARYMIGICPADMLLLENELKKVSAYAGGGELSRKHIDAVVIPKTEARAFDLQRHILGGNAKGALELLSGLFFFREDPIAILGAISSSFCDLYRARAAREAGQSPVAMTKEYGYKSEYRVKKAFENAGKLNIRAARRAMSLLCDVDQAMKSTSVDNKIYLEQLTIKLIAVCGEGH